MIPTWFPTHPPIYNIYQDYAENCVQGPVFAADVPQRQMPKQTIDFLGFAVHSKVGVPAGPLLNSQWIQLASRLGFDILTYKTIRSFAYGGHPLPNILFVEPVGPHRARVLQEAPQHLSDLSITNSFGMPSRSPDFLLQDIEKANRSLGKGQVMIVSVVGSANQGMSFLQDFVRTALIAKTAGAKIIEANFSCPNVNRAEGSLFMDPVSVFEYTQQIAHAIHPVPLILKVGFVQERRHLQSLLSAAARGGARGIAGINTISMDIVDDHGSPALGEVRKTSGVCGSAIRLSALHFLRLSREIIDTLKLDLTLIGCGGILLADHFDLFFQAGVDVAMTATGMMWDPLLALRYHERAHAHSATV